MYKVVIGLEVHCELHTNSKNFSSSKNTYDSSPNTNIMPVDLGLPGIMPVVNAEAVRKALKTAIALNCKNPDELMFDRKNYFYPDLPKGYQITQMTKPLGRGGHLMINVDGVDKLVELTQLHLEEDTASLDHYTSYSLIDYNRSGIPLMEIVTEPCMNSSKEALTFLESLRSIFLYCDVSEAKSDKGQLRCDVNVSLMKENDTELGTRVEVKNINSFSNVKEAIEYEIKRQTEILENGGVINQETRRFDSNTLETVSMRSKVDAVDYKYFVEPNIPPVKITSEFLESIKEEIPPLQYERINMYMEKYELSRYDANVLVKEKEMADFFETTIKLGADPKSSANWITSAILGHLNKYELSIKDIYLTPDMLVSLIELVSSGKISSKQSKEVLFKVLEEEKTPNAIVKELNISQISDEGAILDVVLEVVNESPELIEEYKKGRTNVIDYMVGQVMKKTRGKANPKLTMDMLKSEVEKR